MYLVGFLLPLLLVDRVLLDAFPKRLVRSSVVSAESAGQGVVGEAEGIGQRNSLLGDNVKQIAVDLIDNREVTSIDGLGCKERGLRGTNNVGDGKLCVIISN